MVGVAESTLDTVLTNGVIFNASEINLLCTTLESSTTRETNNVQDEVCLCPMLQFICTLKLGAASSGGCHVLPAPFCICQFKHEGRKRIIIPLGLFQRAVSWRYYSSDSKSPANLSSSV